MPERDDTDNPANNWGFLILIAIIILCLTAWEIARLFAPK